MLQDLFDIGNQVVPARISPQLNPCILHKAPEDLKPVELRRVGRQIKKSYALFLPLRDLRLDSRTGMERGLVRHQNRRTLETLAQIIQTRHPNVAGHGACKGLGLSRIAHVQKTKHIQTFTRHAVAGQQRAYALPGIGHIRHQTKAGLIKIAQINDAILIFLDQDLQRCASRLILLRIRLAFDAPSDAMPTKMKGLQDPLNRLGTHHNLLRFLDSGTHLFEIVGKQFDPLLHLGALLGIAFWMASAPGLVVEPTDTSGIPRMQPMRDRETIDTKHGLSLGDGTSYTTEENAVRSLPDAMVATLLSNALQEVQCLWTDILDQAHRLPPGIGLHSCLHW